MSRPVLTAFDREEDSDPAPPVVRQSPTRGMVTVIEGCEEYCTFCIVPYTRGREVSRREAEVVAEVEIIHQTNIDQYKKKQQTF